MVTKKRGRPINITVPLVKSKSPYGNIEVVSSKSQKIKPTTKIKKVIATSGGTQVKPKKWARVRVRTKK